MDGFQVMPSKETHKLTFTFNQETGETITNVEENLDSSDISLDISRNISKILKDVLISFYKTDVDKLELALNNGSENDFLEALGHQKEDDGKKRKQIYYLVQEGLNKTHWNKSYIKMIARAAKIAFESHEFDIARNLLQKAFAIKCTKDELLFIKLSYAKTYALEGKLDAAIMVLKEVLSADLKKNDYSNVAWCHHNLGTSLIKIGKIQEGISYLRKAGEIRAINNEKLEPQKTLGTIANLLELLDARVSLSFYDEITATIEENIDDTEALRLKGYAFCSAAKLRCLELRDYTKALENINNALPFLKLYLEDEEALATALEIKKICHLNLDQMIEAKKIEVEREEFLIKRPHLESYSLINNVATPDSQWKIELISNLENLDKLSGFELIDFIEEQVEKLDSVVNKSHDVKAIQAKLLSYYGERLAKDKKYSSSIDYFSRAKALHPSNIHNNILLALSLYNDHQYLNALNISKEIMRSYPDFYQGYFVAGMAAFKSEWLIEAQQFFKRAMIIKPDLIYAKEKLEEIDSLILQNTLHGRPISNTPFVSASCLNNHANFLDYLKGFKSRCNSNADAFWKSFARKEFLQNPENIARSLLVQDLQATEPNARVYKESIIAGGRIDLITNILGNEFILELKMCGGNYSKSYAELGFEQLNSYMENRGALRSYLIVFDGRVNQDGENALPNEIDLGDGKIAFCIAVDIRSMKKSL